MTDDRELVDRAVAAGLFADPDPVAPETAVPDKYELLRRLGRGGSGTVWLARDRHLGRDVALKLLTNARPLDVERFRREARLTARLGHPAIVPVYELDACGGRPYIAMQYVPGGDLRSAPLDTRGRVRALRRACEALEHAHGAGVVHRDVKPENVLVDARGDAFVTDFGLARDLAGARGSSISCEGTILGTPALMPPEQARGEIHAVDARSDVYAVGATLFLLLAGRYPFEGDTVVDVLHRVLHDEPPLLRSFAPDAPRALEEVCARCLRKAKSERFQSMRELGDELQRYLDGRGGSGESAWFRRLVHVVVGDVGRPAAEPARAADELDPHWTVAVEAAREVAAWEADLYRVTTDVTRTFPRLDAVLARLEAVLAERPDAAWARFQRGVALARRGRLEEALDAMEASIDRVPDRAGAHFELGRLYLSLHLRAAHRARKHLHETGVFESLQDARPLLERARLSFQEADAVGQLPPWRRHYVDAVRRLADADTAGCVAACDAALALEPDAEEVWKLRGDALHFGGGEPLESYERALAVRRSYWEAWRALAEAHAARGRRDDALAALERALAVHPEYAEAVALAARLELERAGEATDGEAVAAGEARARAALERAIAVDPEDYDAAVALAELELASARRSGAAPPLDRAQEMLERAERLEGCQNRVGFLEASVLAERAAQRSGSEARVAWRAALDFCRENGPDMGLKMEPWQGLVRRIQERLAE